MSYNFIAEKNNIKKKIIKGGTAEENLDVITAKLSTLGISKSNPHRASQQITLSDGTKIIDTTSCEEPRNCNWCRLGVCTAPWGIPLWITAEKKFAIERSFCSVNCCAAFLNYSSSLKYKDSWGLFHLLLNLTGVDANDIVPSLHWTKQEEFGGKWSPEAYKKCWLILSETQEAAWNQLTVATHNLVTIG